MKTLEIKTYGTPLSKLRGIKVDPDRDMDTRDLIEVVLDQIPQAGFSPKDIRDRNRIQQVIDVSRDNSETNKIVFEDEDFKKLTQLVSTSRWGSRDKNLVDFLENFPKESSE